VAAAPQTERDRLSRHSRLGARVDQEQRDHERHGGREHVCHREQGAVERRKDRDDGRGASLDRAAGDDTAEHRGEHEVGTCLTAEIPLRDL
jgi:hypothetical protein